MPCSRTIATIRLKQLAAVKDGREVELKVDSDLRLVIDGASPG
jgi:hypothetical protein